MTRGLRLTQSDLDRMVRDRPTLQHRLDFGNKKRKPRPVKVKAPVASEFQVQAAFVKWTRMDSTRREFPDLAYAFHVPNGELRGRDQEEARRIGAKLKALGLLRGVADWILLAPRSGYHGLIIEFKRPGERVEPGSDQDVWLRHHRAQGFCVHVLTDWERARVAVLGYLRGELINEAEVQR